MISFLSFYQNLCALTLLFRLLALLFPDTSDLLFPFQTYIFWIHHYTLLLFPLVMLWTGRYPLERENHYWFWIAIACAAIFAFSSSFFFFLPLVIYNVTIHIDSLTPFTDIQLVFALLLNLNIKYLANIPCISRVLLECLTAQLSFVATSRI
jgi:hypothetical protein